jgi:hypothetical protein
MKTKVYEVLNNENANRLTVKIEYDLGGMSWATYKERQRGYYFSLLPENVSGNCRSFTAFSGATTCIVPVKRKSKSAEAKADAMFDELEKKYLERWCQAKGYQLGRLLEDD